MEQNNPEEEADFKELLKIEDTRKGLSISLGSCSTSMEELANIAMWIKEQLVNGDIKENGGTYLG